MSIQDTTIPHKYTFWKETGDGQKDITCKINLFQNHYKIFLNFRMEILSGMMKNNP